MSAATHQQPTVTGRKLATREHDGLMLDLYGDLDEDGYFVEDIALAGSKVSLFELVTPAFLESLSLSLDLTMPCAEEVRRQQWAEQRAEYAESDRAFA